MIPVTDEDITYVDISKEENTKAIWANKENKKKNNNVYKNSI
jgi:hypothetical protein